MPEPKLNGFYCQRCSSLIDGEEPGYPRVCEDYKKENRPRKKQGKKAQRREHTDEGTFMIKGWKLKGSNWI